MRVTLFLSLALLGFPAIGQSPGEQAFKKQLSDHPPIQSLRFTEIDFHSRNQTHFFAMVGTNGWFLREYAPPDAPTAPLSFQNPPLNGNFWGQNGDQLWNINSALEVTTLLESEGHPDHPEYYRQASLDARNRLDTVLNLGVYGGAVKRGSLAWNSTNAADFTFERAAGVTVTRSDGKRLRQLSGRIFVRDGSVARMEALGPVTYEYSPNASIPAGIPSKIIMGTSPSRCDKIFVIEEWKYGPVDDGERAFDPMTKLASTDQATLALITNGQRLVVYGAKERMPLPSAAPFPAAGNAPATVSPASTTHWLFAAFALGGLFILVLCLRRRRPGRAPEPL